MKEERGKTTMAKIQEVSPGSISSKRRRFELEGNDTNDDRCSLDFIVNILAENNFLGAKELLILGQTSKQLHQTCIGDDTLWASLCRYRWPCTKFVPKALLENQGQGSFLQLYKLWNSGIAEPFSRPPLSPPSCTADDICLFVHMGYKGAPLIDLNITGREMLTPLLDHGSVEITLENPVVLGAAEWNFLPHQVDRTVNMYRTYHYGLPIQCKHLNWMEFDASIHCLRLTDSAMICLLKSKTPGCDESDEPIGRGGAHPLVQESEPFSTDCQFDLSKPHIFHSLTFPGGVPPLGESQMVSEILSRIRHLVYFKLSANLRIIDPNLVEIYSVRLEVYSNPDHNEHGFMGSIFAGEPDGVSLLHILSELQATHL